ncbi:titin-like [Puntigrus tetrazona]|uniref:titin-like n=1 Tax=Puntigrus tetrazona TaxID=1606681 RepID=UPI001C8A16A1|nr:titin-like [Puntigrus tetrazona]
MGSGALPLILLLMLLIHSGLGQDEKDADRNFQERPKPVVGVDPDRHVFGGETVTLTCDIQQTGDWEYSWNKDNIQDYIIRQDQKYIIRSVDWFHSGVYSCRGTQSEAPTYSQMSDGVTLTVSDKPQPTLTVNPQKSLFTGDTVTLSCDVGQLTGWTIHWIKDSNTDSTGDATKTIESVRVSDGGRYQCRAKRGNYDSKNSKAVDITVKERPKPVVSVDPDRHVFRGETVTLTCDIQQTGDWEYSWNKDNTQDYIIRQDQKYIIRSVDWFHSGVYSCRGTQSEAPTYSQMSDGVTLTVSDKPQPTLTVNPQSSVFTGDTVTLSCDVGQLTGWTIHWTKDSNTDSTSDATKTIKSVRVSDGGRYQCRAKRGNYDSKNSKAVDITVRERPKPVVSVDPDRHVFGGETVTLTCNIQQTGDWEYRWNKDNTQDYIIRQDQKYIITSVDWSHSGVYSCRGNQSKAPTYSQMSDGVTLTVSDKPQPTLTVNPQRSVFTGDTVTLSCDVGQLTGWTIHWTKDSNTDSTSDATKTIKSVRVSDGGRYQCRARRGIYYGKYSNAVDITVRERPKPVVGVDPDRHVFGGETVTLTCDIQQTGDWEYSWNKDNKQDYIIRQDQKYIITSVDWSHSGVYSCRGTQSKAPTYSQMSDGVTLTVSDSPRSSLTVTPDRTVFTGERVTLKCEIESYRDWRRRNGLIYDSGSTWPYEWRYEYKSSSGVVQSYTVNGDTLTIKQSKISDEGDYTCKGKKRRRKISLIRINLVSLKVKNSPRSSLTVTPDRTVFTGERVTLKCVIKSYRDWRRRNGLIYDWRNDWTPDWRYEFYKDRVKLQKSDSSSVTDDTLIIIKATKSDEGQYWCKGQREERPRSSQSSSVSLFVVDLKPKPELTSDPEGAALTGNTVTLTCLVNLGTGWDFYWNKHTLTSETKTETNSSRVKIDSVSDGGQYRCRAGRGTPVYYTHYSDALWVNVTESPKAVVTVRPDKHVFRGETVTLRCDIKWGGDTEWTYRWEIEGTNWYKDSAGRCTKECSSSETDDQKHRNAVSWCSTQDLILSRVEDFHSGIYTCRGQNNTQCSQRSDAVTLKVSAEAQAAVRVSPQPWLTEGDSVTLICEVPGSSTGWTFSWFRDDDDDDGDGLSDSSRGAGDSYTLSPAALQHTGVYTCRAERGRPVFYTHNSSTQLLWITGKWSRVSLKVSPSRSQHFLSHSLSLSCEDQRSSSGWTVRRYTDRKTEDCSKQTGSRCRIDSLSTSDTGVYWCQSESGEKHHPLNITVHNGEVILESSVDPLVEGDTLTLRCLHQSTNSSILGADFYKDGSLVQNQTTGEMNITTVSKSHEGFYYCKTQRGESPKSWISVRAASSSLLIIAVVVGLSVCLLFFISLLLLLRYKKKKDQLHNINQTSVPNPSGESRAEHSPLQSGSDHTYDDMIAVKRRDKEGSDHVYDDVTVVKNGDTDDPFSDVTYSEVTVKKKMDKDDAIAKENSVTYSEVGQREKKCKSKDIDIGEPSDLTYAQINTRGKKKTKEAGLADIMIEMKSNQKPRGKSGESGDTVYSELKNNTVGGADAVDATYAQPIRRKNKTRV